MRPVETIIHVALYDAAILSTSTPGIGLLKPMFPENGLLLTPSIDHLFDRGFIGFEDNGRLIISPVAHHPSLLRRGIDTTAALNVGGFSSGQKRFLDFHRNQVLRRADRT
jgi:hypothetical protein